MMEHTKELAVLEMTIESSSFAVRNALLHIFKDPAFEALPEELRSTVEIVLAEALNNIVEHAYADITGLIAIKLDIMPDAILCTLQDNGRPMPNLRLPENDPPSLDWNNLPEGGFGWHLIYSLTNNLNYTRFLDRNRLSFLLKYT